MLLSSVFGSRLYLPLSMQPFCNAVRCHIAAGPCPLQIVAAAFSVHVNDFSGKIKSRNDFGFHTLRENLLRQNATCRDLRVIEPFRACNRNLIVFHLSGQTPDLFLSQIFTDFSCIKSGPF